MYNNNETINKIKIPLGSEERIDSSRMIDEQHPAFRIVKALEEFDLSGFYDKIIAVKARRGWSGVNPKTMVALFVYAATKGVYSGQAIAAQTHWEIGFRWILGDKIFLDSSTISNFREEGGENLNDILKQVLTVIVASGVIKCDEVILDGTQIKIVANKRNLQTKKGLQALYEEISTKLNRMALVLDTKIDKTNPNKQKEHFDQALNQASKIQRILEKSAKQEKKTKNIQVDKNSVTKKPKTQVFQSTVVLKYTVMEKPKHSDKNSKMFKFV